MGVEGFPWAITLIWQLLFGGTFAGVVSLMLTYVGHKFPGNPAKAMAKLTISYGITQLIAPAAAGYLSVLTGSYHSALWMAAIIMVVGVFLVVQIQRYERMTSLQTCSATES